MVKCSSHTLTKTRIGKTMESTVLFTALREFTTGLLNQLLVNLAGQEGQIWLREFKRFLRKEPCWVMTILQRLISDGKYDSVNSNIIDENFPVPENFVLGSDPKAFHFDHSISSEDVVKEMDKVGYRPAMIWDLLDFGAKNPEEQRKYPIVGLGSVGEIDGGRSVPDLYGRDSERFLYLYWWALSGMPTVVSSVFEKRFLRPRLFDPLGLSLGILDPWSHGV